MTVFVLYDRLAPGTTLRLYRTRRQAARARQRCGWPQNWVIRQRQVKGER